MNRYETYLDNDLMALLRSGDQRAFNAIYDRYWKLLFSVALSKLSDFSDAEEAVQDVFADLWKRRDEIVFTHSLKSYIAGAVKFRVYEILAKRRRLLKQKQAHALIDNLEHENSVDEALRLKILQEEIEQAANQLPERCRLIYKLSREEGYSNKLIAEKLHLTEKTVENQMTRALRFIRKKLKPAVQGLSMMMLFYDSL